MLESDIKNDNFIWKIMKIIKIKGISWMMNLESFPKNNVWSKINSCFIKVKFSSNIALI
jgi:hypothetical protein